MFDSVRSGWSTHRKLMFLKAAAAVPAVEDTATGNPVVFVTDLAKPLKQLNVIFTPKQDSGTPSTENILPITGWDAVNVGHAGKNLFNLVAQSKEENGVRWVVENGIITVSGMPSAYTAFDAGRYKVIKNSVIIISGLIGTRNLVWNCSVRDVEDNVLANVGTGARNITVDLSQYPLAEDIVIQIKRSDNNVETKGTIAIQIETGDTATDYEPYTGQTYPASFPSTIYGGYRNLITGELWKTWEEIASYDGETLPGVWKSDRDVYSQGGTPTTGAQVVYELASPVLITTLTPQQINAINDQKNTIWSDANGDLSVTFLKKG